MSSEVQKTKQLKKNAILLHGRPDKEQWKDPEFPSASNYYWLPWLQKQLSIKGILAQTLEVPNAWRPREHPEVITNKVVLVSPWIDPAGDPGNEDTIDFMNFSLDGSFTARTKNTTVIVSSDDLPTILTSVAILREKVDGIKYIKLPNRGHFYDDRAMQFPELLEEILL